jgi:uncharacterized damage-inducible protein DinB
MTTAFLERPAATEYAEYYNRYISQLTEGDVLDLMRTSAQEVEALLGGLDEAKALHRYAPGKWSIKEVLGHMVDVERMFSIRALRIARADRAPLPGFDQDAYVRVGEFDRRPLASLLAEARHLRAANFELFAHLSSEALLREGTASGYPFTARALIWIIAGHERHHIVGLKRDYLQGASD